MGSNSYSYDANGNMVSRAGDTLSYDAENRLQSVTSGGVTTTYTYDGDGRRAKKDVGGTTTFYVGNWYEVTGATITKYYYFGGQRVAMNQGGAVTYLHTDHLGSTNATSGANTTSGVVFFPFGSPRAGNLPTDFTFTGQRFDASDGLMYYGARYYDAALGRFIQADTVTPSLYNPQALNRYAYVRNNPLRYVDPTGHAEACGQGEICGEGNDVDISVLNMGQTVITPDNVDILSTYGKTGQPSVNVGAIKLLPNVSYWSLGIGGGPPGGYKGKGYDLLIEWKTGTLGLFEWTSNGVAVPGGTSGISFYKGNIWGEDVINSYSGSSYNATGSVTIFTGEYIEGAQSSYKGIGVGGTFPGIGFSGTSANNITEPLVSITVPPDNLRVLVTALEFTPVAPIAPMFGITPIDFLSAWLKR